MKHMAKDQHNEIRLLIELHRDLIYLCFWKAGLGRLYFHINICRALQNPGMANDMEVSGPMIYFPPVHIN